MMSVAPVVVAAPSLVGSLGAFVIIVAWLARRSDDLAWGKLTAMLALVVILTVSSVTTIVLWSVTV